MIPSMNRQQLWKDLGRFPWRNTATVLGERFREDRLGLTASSLTFTTTMALVPFFTVALALFTVFPIFADLQQGLERWLVQSLIPPNIARQVLGYLNQFAGAASGLGIAGLIVLLVTAIALILTIDKTLNNIWRVPAPRPFGQRVLIYWAVLTLGPLLLALSLSTTAWVFAASRGVVGEGGLLRLPFNTLELLLLAGGVAALYHYVPNTRVRWSHAWAGGLFVALAIEVAKRVLGLYLGSVPTYSVMYGAFATVPILLIWIYVAWVIVLLGAVIAAYLPSLLRGVARPGGAPGWHMQLAIEVLELLSAARQMPRRGLTVPALAQRLRVDALQLAPVLKSLAALDWVVELVEDAADEAPRHVLLVEPAHTPLAPLATALMLPRARSVEALWQGGSLAEMKLADVLRDTVAAPAEAAS
ncbi:MAG: YihY family inner membrane protein [Comamonadaceae bacterium]|nr:MAG: YihY family inner membrane protein [Comamonadaceae bacterium]